MRRLICAFVVRIWHKTHFLMARLICIVDSISMSDMVLTLSIKFMTVNVVKLFTRTLLAHILSDTEIAKLSFTSLWLLEDMPGVLYRNCPYLYFGSPIMWVTYLGSWMTTCLGKSCSFGSPRVHFVNCCQFMYLVISLLVLRAGYGIWLYQFMIIAYLLLWTL